MSSKTAKPVMRSAAWRISLWATLAFACGTMLVFVFLHRFVADDIQRRSDAWLSGEVEVLGDVAERTPKDALYDRVVGEVAELAGKEVPNKAASESSSNDSVFFLQTGGDGSPTVGWRGKWRSEPEGHSGKQDCSRSPDGSACQGFRRSLSRGFDPPSMMEVISILDSPSGMNCGC
jgi:hypothetical protein